MLLVWLSPSAVMAPNVLLILAAAGVVTPMHTYVKTALMLFRTWGSRIPSDVHMMAC